MLFRLLPKDAGNPSPRYGPRSSFSQVAATSVNADITNDSNQAWEIENMCAVLIPGAAQTVTFRRILLRYPDGGIFPIITNPEVALAAAATDSINWQGRLIVPPGVAVRASAGFNAGVAANFVSLTVLGSLVSTGNLNL